MATPRKRAASKNRAPTAGANTATGAEAQDNELEVQSRLTDIVQENAFEAGQRRCYQRDANNPNRQCVLSAAHPSEDDNGESIGHIFKKDDGSYYATV